VAFEGLTRAWSDDRVLFRDPAVAVVDKPAGVALKDAGCDSESPSSLPARLFVHGLGPCRVVLGPPERASGATLVALGDSPPGSDGWPRQLETLRVLVGIEGCRLATAGQLEAGAREGQLEYRVLRRNGSRALVELSGRVRPERVLELLARRGQPVVGDTAAGGAAATRLLLHVLELRGAAPVEAPIPVELESWLAGVAVLPPDRFERALRAGAIVRQGLAQRFGAYRLLGEEAGEIAGVSAERYGDFAVLNVSSEEAARLETDMATCLMDHGARGVYGKRRVRADLRGLDAGSLAPAAPLAGEAAPERLRIQQGSLAFWVRLGDGHATGLFLDQRANWDRVRELVSGAAFLNLFCYTGAFTLAAAAGGAASSVSVDLAGRALSRLAENLELNRLEGAQHRLLKSDVLAWLARAARGGRRFGTIVLDPPSFGTRARGVLSTRRDHPELLALALGLLEPGGRLLSVSHHRKISERELGEQVTLACAGLGRAVTLEPLVGGWDCPTLPGVGGTKSVLAKLA
jgi:23S rRNA G2069 N7-methylase RlmK/C1962 C5-methylase RlmI